MCEALSSPPRNIQQLLREREAACRLRKNSPTFRDLLRQRCRSRVKENRQQFLAGLRKVPGEGDGRGWRAGSSPPRGRGTVYEIASQQGVNEALRIEEEMEGEMMEAEVEQLMQSYDMLSATDSELFAAMGQPCVAGGNSGGIPCPACVGPLLVLSCRLICMDCENEFVLDSCKGSLREEISERRGEHDRRCHAPLMFHVVSGQLSSSLIISCHSCSLYHTIP